MIPFLRELDSNSYMKAVILLSLKIHLSSLLLGFFRISFIAGQKHLKSLFLLHDLGGGRRTRHA